MNQVRHVVLRVAHDSQSSALGSVIARELENGNTVELHAIGERAVYVMTKSLCVAQQLLEQAHQRIVCAPAFAAASQASCRTEIRITATNGQCKGVTR